MASASKEPPTDVPARDVPARDVSTRDVSAKDVSAKDALTKLVPAKDVPATNPDSVRVEIFDQVYNLRGSDGDYILKLAEYVDGKMRAVSQQTATVDSVRLAVLAALNIADEYHLLKRRLEPPSPEARQRASKLSSALDEVLQDTRRMG
jgi:cell division protein ZapA